MYFRTDNTYMALLLYLPFFLFLTEQNEVPFKPKDEFQIDVKFELKQKPVNDRYHVDFNETWDDRNKKNSSLIPYLVVNLTLLKLRPEEVRLKGFNSDNDPICNKKAEEGLLVKLNLGFTDDIKDGITPNEFNVFTLDSKREKIQRIHLLVLDDGTFIVNDEVRGKF